MFVIVLVNYIYVFIYLLLDLKKNKQKKKQQSYFHEFILTFYYFKQPLDPVRREVIVYFIDAIFIYIVYFI